LDLPQGLAAVLWRGDELGTPGSSVVATGFDALDHELPGGGWPIGCATELLQPQYSLAEAQLLLPAVTKLSGAQHQVLCAAPAPGAEARLVCPPPAAAAELQLTSIAAAAVRLRNQPASRPRAVLGPGP
jgi:hypothetical protein